MNRIRKIWDGLPLWGKILTGLALVAVAPGGLELTLLLASRIRGGAPAGKDVDQGGPTATVKAGVDKLIVRAKELADQFRSAFKDDPLAAQLAGVNSALIQAGAPADVAADAEKAKADDAQRQQLLGQIADLQAEIANETARYGIDHNGGQSQGEFNNRIAQLNAQIAAIQTQIAKLGA